MHTFGAMLDEEEDHEEGTPVAVAVVAPIRCADHGRVRRVAALVRRGHRYALLGASDWLPQEDFLSILALGDEEGAAVATVERPPGAAVRGGEGEGRGGGGDEAGDGIVGPVVEEAEHGGFPMELVEAAAEAVVGDGAAPGLADDGGA